MTMVTAEHLERLRHHLVEWVGEQIIAARNEGRGLAEIVLDAEEWAAVKGYLARKDKFWKRSAVLQGRVRVQGVWLRPGT